jgi:hypothetical protein
LFAYFADKNLVSRIFRGGDEFMTEYANRHNTLFGILYGKFLLFYHLGVDKTENVGMINGYTGK